MAEEYVAVISLQNEFCWLDINRIVSSFVCFTNCKSRISPCSDLSLKSNHVRISLQILYGYFSFVAKNFFCHQNSVTWILVVILIQVLICLNLIGHNQSHSLKGYEEAKQFLKADTCRCRRDVLLELVGEQCSVDSGKL